MPNSVEPVVPRGRLCGTAQPVLRSDGLVLRPWEAGDAPVVLTAYDDPDIRRWHLQSLTAAEASVWVASRRDHWAAETGADWAVADDHAVLGRVGLHDLDLAQGSAEVVYWVLPAARGHDVAARSLRALTAWAFAEVGLHRLELSHGDGNDASCHVAVRAGFRHEGTRRANELHPDGWRDTHLHARLTTDPA